MRAAMGLRIFASVSMLALGVTAQDAAAVPMIDTSGDTVVSTLYSFGEPNTATEGQTFKVTGAETQLNSFSFRFNDYAPGVVDFAAYVYAWDGQKASGSALYTSGKRSSTNNGGKDGYEAFTFNTGGISLVSGQQYVAFLSASLFFDGQPSWSTWEMSNGYSGGNLVYFNNGSNFGLLTSQTWTSITAGFIGTRDLWFVADFSTPTPVPEPDTAALLVIGIGMALARRRASGNVAAIGTFRRASSTARARRANCFGFASAS